MLKRILCLALALVFALSLVACSDDGGKDAGKTSGKGSTSMTDGKLSSGGVSIEVEDEKVLESELAKKTYGGQSFVFYYWYEYGDIIDRKVALFNKERNANIKISIVSGNFEENIAKSIASGSPYDLIANHGIYFPQSIFADIYEPLESYISDVDYFDAKKPGNGGISKIVNDTFTWKGKLYACGSAKAVYQDVVYYNKQMFQTAGLEDPMALWEKGEWTWEKFKSMGAEVTDVANNIGFVASIDLTIWWTLKGVSPVITAGDTYKENLGSTEISSATQEYVSLFYGDNPISVAKTGSTAMTSGKAFTMISSTDGYAVYAEQAKKSGAFGRNANNLGVVPVPTGLADTYPGHAPQGYSCGKGAKEPSLPAAYALFESRTKDEDIASTMQMPAKVRNYVEEQFAINGFLGFAGLQNSEGLMSRPYLDPLGGKIRNGEDPVATIEGARAGLTRMIADSLANAF